MRLTQLFVNRPTLVFVLLATIVLAGVFAGTTIVQQNLPNIDFPTVNVSVSYPGASATELRDSVVRPIEDAIAGAPDLDHINTTIQQNQASISATFGLDSNQTTDLVEVQDRVQSARSALPADMPAPSIRTFDPAQATVVTLSLTSNSLSLAGLSAIVTDKIVPALEQVPGISFVNAGGTVTPALEVTVDPGELSASGYTLNDVVNAIQANNVRAPGGIAYLAQRETTIDVRGDVQSPDSVASLLLTGSSALPSFATSPSGTAQTRFTGTVSTTNQALTLGGSSIAQSTSPALNPFSVSAKLSRIGDVAIVTDWYEPKRVSSYVNGLPALTLGLQKQVGASEVAASEAALAALPDIERQFPDVAFKVLNVQADFTKQQLLAVLATLIEGIAFTAIAMLFFLRSWRNGLVVMIAIPASLLVTLFVMKLWGFTIDTVSLLAMTLIIGILVDDSIVVLENVERHYEDGEAPRTAAILGRSEIGMAAVVITLVDVVVFLPIAFLPGITGRFLGEFGVVVTIATLTSLLISFTVTPALAGNWSLLSTWKAPGFVDAFTRGFNRLRSWYVDHPLSWSLRNPWKVVAISVLATAGAIALLPLGLDRVRVPSRDRPRRDLRAGPVSDRHSPGDDRRGRSRAHGALHASARRADHHVDGGQLPSRLRRRRQPRFERPVARLPGPEAQTVDDGHRAHDDGHRAPHGSGRSRRRDPRDRNDGRQRQPIDITVSSTRGDASAAAERVLAVLQDTPGTANVNSSALQMAPQIDIEFDRDRARALDVDIGSAASAVRAAFGGTLATQFDTTNGTKYVQVLYPMSAQTSTGTLNDIALRTRGGSVVRLADVAIFKNAPALPLITRVNRQTVIHVVRISRRARRCRRCRRTSWRASRPCTCRTILSSALRPAASRTTYATRPRAWARRSVSR